MQVKEENNSSSDGIPPLGRVLAAHAAKADCHLLWSGALAFVIVLAGQAVWGILVTANLKAIPSLPWAALVMAVVLFLMCKYLGGKWWPTKTSERAEN